ncbi:hypothetical protein Trichorick_01778 (plasmid) [Candidatus Trichorickettsia mobilis]|uniref:hypothetical protein n=1 Tax=Candidatus Trichorickettsia mobilis TaxID=1346319 RepID=UPI002B262EFE|nr:hypothetical protein [Candidatus Trichorickettsia mobilis]WPY01855.1 hypothetical protein Trichorick_01778 [Candidatus Trichorickettsia mobilis]
MIKSELTLEILKEQAAIFAEIESLYNEPTLYGVTDGKAVGTYLEHKFTAYLLENYSYAKGNSASGIDIPDLEVDIKVTSIRQPQSSCPFESARQKIYGLGYNLLVFVYEKTDQPNIQTSRLNIHHTIFVDKERTGDFQTTKGIINILENEGNIDDLIAFMQERNLPIDDIEAKNLATRIISHPPVLGYLTMSNALQWRLQYGRIIQKAGEVEGIWKIR